MPDPSADLLPDPSYDAVLPGRIYTVPSNPSEFLAAFQRALVLSACPRGTTISEVCFAPQYTVKGPALVVVTHPDGCQHTLVVKMSGTPHGVLTEAKLLPVLARLGLP